MEGKQGDNGGRPILNGKDPRVNNKLFEEIVLPKYDYVLSIVRKYTDRSENVDENFAIVLTELYKYIQSYDPSKKLDTWLHICAKRTCQEQNFKRYKQESKFSDNDPFSSQVAREHIMQPGVFSTRDMSDCLPDEMVCAMRMIQPHKLSAFILQVQGFTIKEIAEIEYMRGHLDKKNEGKVKSRIFQARKELKELLNRDGTSKSSLLKIMIEKMRGGCGKRESKKDYSGIRPDSKED